jgi:hypothetical protein
MAIQRLIYGKEHVAIVFCAALLISNVGKNFPTYQAINNIKRLLD